MAYIASLGPGQQVVIQNQGQQTMVTLQSVTAGQQQSQQISLQTGSWTAPPSLFHTPAGYLLRIESAQGQAFLQLQSSGMQVTDSRALSAQAQAIALHPLESAPDPQPVVQPMQPMQPTQPMQPMQPMKPLDPMPPLQMGNMQMQMNPMTMRMGDMELKMGNSSPQAEPSPKSFCPQCGNRVGESDRFCAHCGHRLVAV